MVREEMVSVHDMSVVARMEATYHLRMLVREKWKLNREIAGMRGVKHDFYARSKELVRFEIRRLRMVYEFDNIILDYLKEDAFKHDRIIRY